MQRRWQRVGGTLVLVATAAVMWRLLGIPWATRLEAPAVRVQPERDTAVKASQESAKPSNPMEGATHGGALLAGEARDRIRQLIWDAFLEPPPTDTMQPSPIGRPDVLPFAIPLPPGLQGRLEHDHIRDRMHADFFPMASGCYAEAEERLPGLTGSIVLHFTIVGDDTIGGIVESADVMDRSTIRDSMMIECLRQSMLSMTFSLPKQRGLVTVDYPIDFDPDEEG